MKQITISFNSISEFKANIPKIRKLKGNSPDQNLYFKIFTSKFELNDVVAICSVIEESFPMSQYIGCSSLFNILDGVSTPDETLVICTLLEKKTSSMDIFHFPFLDDTAFANVDKIIDKVNSMPDVKGIEMLVPMDESSRVKELCDKMSRLNENIQIFGGCILGVDRLNSNTFTFSKSKGFKRNEIIFVLWRGEELHLYSTYISGWQPLSKEFTITKGDGHTIEELDGSPAFNVYEKYLGIGRDEYFKANTLEFPLFLRKDDINITRSPIGVTDDGAINLAGTISQGDIVSLAYGDPQTILNDVMHDTRVFSVFEPDAIAIYSCAARRAFWGHDRISEETKALTQIAPSSGIYTHGEYLRVGKNLYNFNVTLVLVGIREGAKPYNRVIVDESNIKEMSGASPMLMRLSAFIDAAIKDLQEANIQLEEKSIEANMANRAKSQFLANMSHEIRTPLNAILGFNTMILRECQDENIKHYAEDIQTSGQSLLSIINDLLDFSKIESGKMEIIPIKYNITKIIHETVNMMNLNAMEKGLKLTLDMDDDLPVGLFGDDIRIKQILINILSNAIKYTPKGSVTLSVHGSKNEDTEALRIEVKDTGIGIKQEDIATLTDKFKRIENEGTRAIQGTGLGLSITLQLLSLMGSTLEIESEFGVGSTFGFTLIQKILDDTPANKTMAPVSYKSNFSREYKESFTAPDAKILLVDDTPINRKVIKNLLKATQVQISEASSGFEAIELCKQTRYDLILLDHLMPEMDGVETLASLMNNEDIPNFDTPVIALTANKSEHSKEYYEARGFRAYVSKPVHPAILEEAVRNNLPKTLIK